MSFSSPDEVRKDYGLLMSVCTELLKKYTNSRDIGYCKGVLAASRKGFQNPAVLFNTIQDMSDTAKYILVTLYSISFIVALFGNGLVILTFTCNRHMRSVMNVFILSLAISDFLITITCTPMNIGTSLSRYWILGGFACKATPFMTTLCVASSSLTLCCIAFDRYTAVVHPLKRNVNKRPVRVAGLLVAVWVIAVSASIPYPILYDIYSACKDQSCKSVIQYCYSSRQDLLSSLEIWLTLIVLLMLPLTGIAVTYGIVIWKLWSKKPIGTRIPTAEDLRTRYRKKAVKMMILVVLLFVFCWSPLLLFDVIGEEDSLRSSRINVTIRYYLQWFALSSAGYNPIIYAFMNERFRKNFVKILSCRGQRVAPSTRQIETVHVRSLDQQMTTGNHSETTSGRF